MNTILKYRLWFFYSAVMSYVLFFVFYRQHKFSELNNVIAAIACISTLVFYFIFIFRYLAIAAKNTFFKWVFSLFAIGYILEHLSGKINVFDETLTDIFLMTAITINVIGMLILLYALFGKGYLGKFIKMLKE